jgi:hypothetical protein
VGVHRVGGELAGHRDAVVDQVVRKVSARERLTKETASGTGTGVVER